MFKTGYVQDMNDKKIKLYSPEIDRVLETVENKRTFDIANEEKSYKSKKTATILQEIFNQIQNIKPEENGPDKTWSIWLRSHRGPLSAFADYEEYQEMKENGEIDDLEDLKSLWKAFYPEKIKWHMVSFVLYDRNFFVTFDSKVQIKINLDSYKLNGTRFKDSIKIKFLTWLSEEIKSEINKFCKDPKSYNKCLSKNLPLSKRFGKIKRMILWEKSENVNRLDEELGLSNLKKFENAVKKIDKEKTIKKITADDYFHFCEICYDANQYFQRSEKINPREKYRRMADGRDEGLLKVDGSSQKAFIRWYNNRFAGGHPWEICRGGNSTHISLMVSKEKEGWKLFLQGYSRIRVVETAKMAIALFENKTPYVLINANQIINMIKGKDTVGIVPENITPRYCHSYFPEEDEIFDFINPWYDKELEKIIKKYAEWYPVNTLKINNKPKI